VSWHLCKKPYIPCTSYACSTRSLLSVSSCHHRGLLPAPATALAWSHRASSSTLIINEPLHPARLADYPVACPWSKASGLMIPCFRNDNTSNHDAFPNLAAVSHPRETRSQYAVPIERSSLGLTKPKAAH